ncbi:MAG: permease-like cell division protein FtsX [Bifidobacteriaceae bacterium]|jgi:cell division transport system permease protein|nr:permease-like cell division protein FtsX [Bifidobacteriaceae bacterium]
MRFRFVAAEILHGFRRNLSMIGAVILVTFVSLSAVGAALMLQMQVDRLKGDWYGKVEVSIFLCPVDPVDIANCAGGAVTQDQKNAVRTRLESPEMAPYVAQVFEQDRESVLAEYYERYGEDYLPGQLTVDAFGPVLHVKLTEPVDETKFDVVTDTVSTMPGVLEAVDQSDLLGQLFDLVGKIRLAALAAAGVLALAAVLLITTTIRLSALSRQRETGIMRLVGASNLFIQLPFMLEGAVAALLGSVLAVATLWGGSQFLVAEWVETNFALLMGKVNPLDALAVAPWLVGAAVVLAGLSSALTLRRFTRV